MPRCYYPGLYEGGYEYPPYDVPWDYRYPQPPTREQEVGILRERADYARQELEEIERRIQELQKKEE